ncbi:PF04463 family protein [Fusobacterium necrophorum subsp. funduliforme ATCC 51357]|mgnify:FL=1|uniref:Uncharacterized protein n=4 Tax=Fusobacterium necrophorum TaxID=859 RepID=A0A161QUN5_9FUSO|nr:DUF523 domain-containing protein [Fusobacterium necrophorum]EHO21901.1 hypothetical protein HMPREF9466_00276 [Fusobacterium necrophorum subsp. funduliforme 1_1_36S]AVQ20925.1 DUF523 domain-containing protein [Fusobacterium necrophorum subsp. funduliforme]AYV92624.1 DUF523 domain-containing protein [Fusobacterium necrophorum subsp. funduliforme]AYZ74161.1 DUF523 domain-containing protein [Fusobacterium necrophorum]AZW09958.1 DUF523 domain-containing protein [Fusobacterium necrophorum subsp. 
MEKEKILISACLLGIPCRYDGRDNKIESLNLLQQQFDFVPICPEQLGGLSTPRCPCEIQGNKVMSKEGKDCTREFQEGAEKSLKLAKQWNIKTALLKAKSPSCGFGQIYDGSFSKKLITGNGLTAALLEKEGIRIFCETELDKFLKKLYNEIDN